MYQYHDQLIAEGWDDLDFLNFTDEDLRDVGINLKEHRDVVSSFFPRNKTSTLSNLYMCIYHVSSQSFA